MEGLSRRQTRCSLALALASAACLACVLGCSTAAGEISADAGVDADAAPPAPQACTRNDDCGGDTAVLVCDVAQGKCVTPCTIARELCEAHKYCDEVTKVCVPGCSSDQACPAAADGGARTGRCDLRAHACVECLDVVDCNDGFLCSAGRCVQGCNDIHPCAYTELCCGGACVDTQTNVEHCGECGVSCTADNGAAACIDGACAITSCTAGHADCDGKPRNGCEADTTSDSQNCGVCGHVCANVPHADAWCRAGACEIAACYSTFRDCDQKLDTGCESNSATDVRNCGACGSPCTPATNACESSQCVPATCPAGLRDCDDDPIHTCETDINTSAASCGGCGLACLVAHGVGRCAAGTCAVDRCTGSFADCDGKVANGCEVDLASDPAHCGACTKTCGPGATCGTSLVATMDTFPSGWVFNGFAVYDVTTGSAVLTAAEGQTSTLFYQSMIAIDAFDVTFDFRIGGGGGTGADGMGLVLQNDNKDGGVNEVGGPARGLGMAGLTGYGIELDTFPDLSNIGPCEPVTEHIAIDNLFNDQTADPYCQQAPKSLETNGSLPLHLRNSGWHTVEVHWNGASVRVSVDGAIAIPTYAIPNFVPGSYFVGFSAASGILQDRHEVRNVRFDFPNVRCL